MDSKFHKTILLMLLSSEPGEVMAAREAILRMGKSQKLDAHQLVSVMTQGLLAREIMDKANERAGAVSASEARDIAQYCWQQFEKGMPAASERERRFVQDMMNCSGRRV